MHMKSLPKGKATVTFMAFVFCLALFLLWEKEASADSVNVRLEVSVCNANLVCEAVIGENYGSCPSDCEAPPPPPPATTTPPDTLIQDGSGIMPGSLSGKSFFTAPTATLTPSVPNAIQSQPNRQNGPNKPLISPVSTIKPGTDPAKIPKPGIIDLIRIAIGINNCNNRDT